MRQFPFPYQIIGNTPMVRLKRVPKVGAGQVLVKLEDHNFGGSVKSRVAKHLIRDAERRGLLVPGGTIIEASSGNLGIALAAYGVPRGYKVVIFVDPKTTPTNLRLLEAYGAQVEMVNRPDGGSYQAARNLRANELHQQTPNSYRPDQLFNPQNPHAHFCSTAPEIMRQCGGQLDYVVLATGSGGQVGGISHWFGLHAPHVKVVAVDPVGSAIFGAEYEPYQQKGVGLDFASPNIKHPEWIDSVYKVADGDAFLTCRVLVRQEGLLLGESAGACVFVAVKLASSLGQCGRVVALAPDSGERYLATVYDDEWLAQHGYGTNTSLEEFSRQVENLEPYSLYPEECVNSHPEKARELGSSLARKRGDRSPIDTPLTTLTPAVHSDGHVANGKLALTNRAVRPLNVGRRAGGYPKEKYQMNQTGPTIAFLVGGEKEHEDDARLVAHHVQEAGGVCHVHNAREVVSSFDEAGATFSINGEEIRPDLLVGYVCKAALLPTLPVLQAMERRGFRILNTATTLQTCQNKFLTSEALLREGIPHFPTLGGFGPVPPDQHLPERMSRYPLVNKPETGSGGRHNLLLKNRGELDLAASIQATAGQRWHLQPYVEKPGQRDIRVICFGYRPVFAFFRYAPPGGWVTNIAVGGRSERISEIAARLGEVAAAASRAVGASISGVDLVEDPDTGYRVFEINSLPSLNMDRHMPDAGQPLYPLLAHFLVDVATGN